MKTKYIKTGKLLDYKPISKIDGKWYVCFWCNELKRESEPVLKGGKFVNEHKLESTGLCSYSYIVYDTKPSIEVIKNDLEEIINANVSKKIEYGFVFNGNKIHLSKENQMNYKANYDLALQTNGQNLPLRIKTTKNGKTEYIIFFTPDEFSKFYLEMNKFINNALEEGWKEKDSIDYSIYKA